MVGQISWRATIGKQGLPNPWKWNSLISQKSISKKASEQKKIRWRGTNIHEECYSMSYYSMDKTTGHRCGGRTQISYLYPLLVPENHFLPENALQLQMWKKIMTGRSTAEWLRGTSGGHLVQPPAQAGSPQCPELSPDTFWIFPKGFKLIQAEDTEVWRNTTLLNRVTRR